MAVLDDNNWQELSDQYKLTLENVGATRITELIAGGCIGSDDAVDYRRLTVSESGLYAFHLYNLTNPAELTVYVETNGKLRELEDEDGDKGEHVTLSPLRLEAGRTYYIAVRPEDISRRSGATYSVGISAAGTPGQFDDEWQTAPAVTVPGDRRLVDMDLISDDYIGGGDSIDYRRVTLESDGTYTLTLDDLGSSAKLTLYRVNGNTITEVSSVTGDRKRNGIMRNIDLAAGEYVIAVEAGSGTRYDVEIAGTVHSGRGDGSDDNYLNAPALTVSPDNSENVGMQLVPADWVGYDDLVDFRQLNVTDAGSYTFLLDNLEANAKITLYTLKNGKLKSVKAASGKAGREGAIRDLLLEAGVYYLSVEATGTAKKNGTAYDVSVSGSAFTKGDTADDVWNQAPSVAVPGGSGRVDQALIDNDWTGYGDLVDFREVSIDTPGAYTFRLDPVAGNARLTLYTLKNGKLKKLKSASGNVNKDGVISNVLLDSGNYYVAVEATGKTQKSGTDYDLDIYGHAFTKGDTGNNSFTDAYALGAAGTASGWVGYGDATDFYRFSLSSEAQHGFALDADRGEASLIIYREEGGKMKVVKKVQAGKSLSGLKLEAGNYFLEVRSGDNGKGKKNTDYTLRTSAVNSLAYGTAQGLTEAALSMAAPDLLFGEPAWGAGTGESVNRNWTTLV